MSYGTSVSSISRETLGVQSNTPYTAAGEVTRNIDSEALANTASTLGFCALNVPKAIGHEVLQDPFVLVALIVDSNRTMIDDLLTTGEQATVGISRQFE